MSLAAGFPSSPIVDPGTGLVTPVWRGFLLQMFLRTGGGTGADLPGAVAAVKVEAAARELADSNLADQVSGEAATRAAADQAVLGQAIAAVQAEAVSRRVAINAGGASIATEAAARAAGDAAVLAALSAETAARIAADALQATIYVYTQGVPASTWHITHNLGTCPAVNVIDSSGRLVEGDMQFVDSNTLVVGFSAPFSGTAYLI